MSDGGQAPVWEGETNGDWVAGPDGDVLGERIHALSRAAHIFNVRAAQMMQLGPNDLWALSHLLSDGPLGPAVLAKRLGLTAAAMTTLLDRLERAGHVERHPHPTDRRRLVVAPTAQADHDAYRTIAPLLTALSAAEADLTAEERDAVARYLDRVIAALLEFGEPERQG